MFEVKLDVDLPMDERQNAQTADSLVKSGLASKRYVREKILTIDQSSEMEKEIAKERITDAMLQAETQNQVQAIMLKAQQEQQASMPQQAPQGQPSPEQGMPPPEQGMPPLDQGQSAQDGLPMTAPMDPTQMQGNGLPPEGLPMGGM
jgi:hypothetical protein